MHGSDGLDELTTTGESLVAELTPTGQIRRFTVTPEDAGLRRASLDELKGGDPQHNAQALRRLLDGETGAYRDIVLLNAAAALILAGKAESLAEGAALAARSIDEGQARSALQTLSDVTHEEYR